MANNYWADPVTLPYDSRIQNIEYWSNGFSGKMVSFTFNGQPQTMREDVWRAMRKDMVSYSFFDEWTNKCRAIDLEIRPLPYKKSILQREFDDLQSKLDIEKTNASTQQTALQTKITAEQVINRQKQNEIEAKDNEISTLTTNLQVINREAEQLRQQNLRQQAENKKIADELQQQRQEAALTAEKNQQVIEDLKSSIDALDEEIKMLVDQHNKQKLELRADYKLNRNKEREIRDIATTKWKEQNVKSK